MNKIGVVILNYKTYKDTIRLANDLLSFGIKNSLHIVIVDNQSPNESYKCLTSEFKNIPSVSVIQAGTNGGFAKGNNVGLRYLQKINPKYCLILNNDVYFDEATLLNCIHYYEILPNPGLVSPTQLLPTKEIANVGTLRCNTMIEDLLQYSLIWKKFRKKTKYTSNSDFSNIRIVDIIPGCFIFINYKFFQSIGFFDEDTFLFCEERFLYKKIFNAGHVNYMILDDGYVHDHSSTIKREVASIRQLKYYNDGQIIFTKKFRKLSCLKSFLLKLAFKIYVAELSLVRLIKKNKFTE